ncbi:MAG: ABC transporter ATP-binding protein [Clostridia bacterium]|nr:ABC transporter ATP-binding protein [Clostridia bacterium]MBR2389083.1 ABC transporter ATP-binding protein [Clostridia bacterium]
MAKNVNTPPENMPPIGRRGGGPMGSRMKAEKPKNTKKALMRLLRYIGKSKFLIIILVVIMALATVAELAGPALQGLAIDTIELHEDGTFSVDFPAMLEFLILMGVLFALSAVLHLFQGRIAARLSQNTVYSLRNDLFKKISRLPIKYTDTHKHGDIMSRMTNDVENVSNAISQSIASLISSVLTLVGAFAMMIYYNPIIALIACITIPITITLTTKLAKFMRKYFVRQQKILGKLNGQIEEMVTSYKTVVAYGKEGDAVEAFAENSEELKRCSIRARVWGSIMGPCMNFLGNLQYVLIAVSGGFFMIYPLSFMRPLTVGNIQSMLQYSKKFTRPINEIANQYSSILTALAGAERIFEIMDSADEIDEGTSEISPADIEGNIEFSSLDFAYVEGEPVLKGLSLSVKAGEKVAIVGATGSGKTTVVNLLTRFYELDGGKITIDGIDVRDIPKSTLRHATAIVLQDTVLFSDTIRANIKYGKEDASDEEIRRAAAFSKADRFIERLENGYDTVLSEGGSDLSQGQRQLLSIARAVLADPKILILDEATSSVDTRTEMHIQQAMIALMKNRTSLIIAHRLSTIRDADKIVVVDDGRIVESGNHEELLSARGKYFSLYQNQFAGQVI